MPPDLPEPDAAPDRATLAHRARRALLAAQPSAPDDG